MGDIEYLTDIEGADHLFHDWGERFRGWYMFRHFLREEEHDLHYPGKDVSYTFKVCDYHFKWIMPSMLEFIEGSIAYDKPERLLGVFRFPQNADDGHFSAPIPMKKISEDLKKMSKKEIEDMIKDRKVLTFEAFRIPQFGFEFISLEDEDLEAIAKQTDRSFAREIRAQFESEISAKEDEVREKILASPNNLLILENVLNRQLRDMAEVSKMTSGILHI